MPGESETPGRRERKRAATRADIYEAARALFSENPFESVTVQQIADRCDLAVGTLFYHAPNKTELLLMVYNVVLEHAIAEGEAAAVALSPGTAAAPRVMALIQPVARLVDSPQAANLTRYHRDLLFGDTMGPHRRHGIALVRRLEADVARVLCSRVGQTADPRLADHAARAVFAALHFQIAAPPPEPAATPAPGGDALLAAQVDLIVRGFTAACEGRHPVIDAPGVVRAPPSAPDPVHPAPPRTEGT